MKLARKTLPCLTLVLLAGCITAPPRSGVPSRAPADTGAVPSTREAEPRGATSRATPPRAATLLLEQARSERAAGQLASAESAIERALRIEPNDPWLWIELGEIKRAGGDGTQAAAMGRKALSLAAGDRDVETSARALLR